MLLSLNNINKYYNGNQILKNIDLTIEDNDRTGLVGINGCGKSTLLRLITQEEDFDRLNNVESNFSIAKDKTFGILKQNSGLENDQTIQEEMRKTFSNLLEIANRLRELELIMSENHNDEEKYNIASKEYAEKSAFFEAREGYIIDVKIKTILNGMGFSDLSLDRKINTLSGGEKTRLALAKLLLESPDLLILDEPTNHLDFKTLQWLEDYLKTYKGALLIVSHDRYFLDRLCTKICEIERGELRSFKGNYSSFTVQKKMLVERQMKEYEQQQLQISELNDYIQRNKVRASTSNMAKSREKQLEKIELIQKPLMYNKTSAIHLEYEITPPKDILKVEGLEIAVGEGEQRKTLVNSLDMEVKRGEKLAIIGSNGIGKSTILKFIQNKLPVNKGKIEWARNVKISFFEQENTHLNFKNTVIDELHKRFPRETEQKMRDLLGRVLFSGENVFKPVGVISGGERAKLCFAIMMYEHGNVLILDEPTNHLDLATKEVLEQALEEFDGTIIFVSHDRYLLNKISTKILEITTDEVCEYKGNFDFYTEQKKLKDDVIQKEIDTQKQEIAKQKAEEKNVKVYRNKEQRANEVKRKNEMKCLEKEIELLQTESDEIEKELSNPDISSDYEKMHEKCNRLEELKQLISEKYDKWIELDE